jgi:LPXTG-site transpeptidase (sortase) family protein
MIPEPGLPVRVIIPAINLDSKILSLGKEKNGEMSVPSGKSNDVGWYKYGTVPGNMGSAVLDAHVFAAFANLDKLKAGDNIFVVTDKGEKLRFVVGEAKTYKLNALSPNTLFHQSDAKRLNLITCAGSLTKDKSTYTHRRVVFAVLADTYVA